MALSLSPAVTDSDEDRRRVDEARRSPKKLRQESRIKELAKGLWSEASDGEQVTTVRDLREDKELEQTLDEIFRKTKTSDPSKKKVYDEQTSPLLSRSPSPVDRKSRLRAAFTSADKTKRRRQSKDSRSRRHRDRRHYGSDSERSLSRSPSPVARHRAPCKSANRTGSLGRSTGAGARWLRDSDKSRRGKTSGRNKTITTPFRVELRSNGLITTYIFPGRGSVVTDASLMMI